MTEATPETRQQFPDGVNDLRETTRLRTACDSLDALGREECLTLLRTSYVGRLGYVDGERPVIVSINYRVAADGAVLFLTGEGLKLEAARAGRPLCLAVDGVDSLSHSGWSVLLTGAATVVDPAIASREASSLRLRTWARGAPRTYLVTISPDRVEGRRLGRHR